LCNEIFYLDVIKWSHKPHLPNIPSNGQKTIKLVILPNTGNFTLTLEPETIESRAKAQKTQILA